MNDLFWNVMLEELAGAKFTTFGLYRVAELNTGEVVNAERYELLTNRLYEPTAADRFAAK